jgi:uncharacterized protein
MNRRHALCCGAALAAGLFTSLRANAAPTLREGLRNPCRGAVPTELLRHDIVQAAFDGLDPTQLWDTHAHLLGTGDSGSGCTIHPSMSQWWHPIETMRRRFILDAACVDAAAPSIDRAYREHLVAQTQAFPSGVHWLLFAFDRTHTDEGRADDEHTTFHVPNAYAAEVARSQPDRFGWVASVHPYRADALTALQSAIANGAQAVKWLPSAMNIDPRDPRCRPFYNRLARERLPLIVHAGEEKAAPGAGRESFGNPLLMRVPLSAGVRVIVAHAGSLGEAQDTDRRSAPAVPAFELLTRLMDEPAWKDLLLADISALFQANRTPDVWRTVLQRQDWHPRLLHGSDHPLPGIMPLYAPTQLADAGLLDAAKIPLLRRIREHNPLLFDFVLKRHLKHGSSRLSSAVFHTRRHFERT